MPLTPDRPKYLSKLLNNILVKLHIVLFKTRLLNVYRWVLAEQYIQVLCGLQNTCRHLVGLIMMTFKSQEENVPNCVTLFKRLIENFRLLPQGRKWKRAEAFISIEISVPLKNENGNKCCSVFKKFSRQSPKFGPIVGHSSFWSQLFIYLLSGLVILLQNVVFHVFRILGQPVEWKSRYMLLSYGLSRYFLFVSSCIFFFSRRLFLIWSLFDHILPLLLSLLIDWHYFFLFGNHRSRPSKDQRDKR